MSASSPRPSPPFKAMEERVPRAGDGGRYSEGSKNLNRSAQNNPRKILQKCSILGNSTAKRESDFKPEGTTGFNPRNMGKGNEEVGERLKAKIGKAGPKNAEKAGGFNHG